MWILLSMLKPNSERILRAIVQRCQNGSAEVRIDDIVQASGCSRRTVRRHVRRLEGLEYFSVQRPSEGIPYSFQIQPKALEELKN
jgi:hypothetical protein